MKRGWCVNLGPSPIEFLANPPLIDGVWIDQLPVELADLPRSFAREASTSRWRIPIRWLRCGPAAKKKFPENMRRRP